MSVEFDSCSDEDIAAETQGGSLEAFEELVSRYERRIYRFASQRCGVGMDAAEITQETFVKAYQSIGQYKPGCRFAAWLFTIARHNCIDHFRRTPPVSDRQTLELVDISDPAQLLVDRETRDGIWELARQSLPEPQFQALWLRYVEDMSVKDVARVLRKTQMHVKVLLFRARKAMARQLVPSGQSSSSRANTSETESKSPETFQAQSMRPITVGDDVRSLITARQTRNQRLLTSSPTSSS